MVPENGAAVLRSPSLSERRACHDIGHVVATLQFGIPIISVSIIDRQATHAPCNYRAPPGIGLEAMCILALTGPASEELFCGKIEDGGDHIDVELAKRYLARRFDALQIGVRSSARERRPGGSFAINKHEFV
jgi:hypothetical protein